MNKNSLWISDLRFLGDLGPFLSVYAQLLTSLSFSSGYPLFILFRLYVINSLKASATRYFAYINFQQWSTRGLYFLLDLYVEP